MRLFTILFVFVTIISILLRNSLRESYQVYQDQAYEKTPSSILFNDVTSLLNVDYHHRLRHPMRNTNLKDQVSSLEDNLSSLMPSIAVHDFNSDGYMDFIVSTGESERPFILYENIRGETFRDVTESKFAPYDRVGMQPSNVAWIDIDLDGHKDIYLGGWGCDHIFIYKNGTYYHQDSFQDKWCLGTQALGILDYNNDGYPDLAVGNYVTSLFHSEPYINSDEGDKDRGGVNYILVNNTMGGFIHMPPFKEKAFTMSIGLGDISGNGRPDLLFTNDFSTDDLYINSVNNDYINMTPEYLPIKNHGYAGMGVSFADVNNDGKLDIYVSNIYKPPFDPRGNNLWVSSKEGKFVELAGHFEVDKCGYSWGNRFADFNNNGQEELLVVNGYFRGRESTRNTGESYWWQFMQIRSVPRFLRKSYLHILGDRNFDKLNYSGYERSCLFRRDGGKYIDIASEVGLDEDLPSRSLAIIDFNNNGKLDLIIGNYGYPLKIYKNISKNSGHWIGFELHREKNKLIEGTKITLILSDGTKMLREIFPTNGFKSQSDPRAHFGIGKKDIVNINIVWPDGANQSVDHFNLNTYNIINETK
jgi:enediyne biosynthesis protein E4